MKKLMLASLVVVVQVSTALAQDYIAYERIINRVDRDLLAGDSDAAAVRMDSIAGNYSFVYARHCLKALQIACVRDDVPRADRWLARCFIQGVPRWALRTNILTQKALSYPGTQTTLTAYDSLRAVYKNSIDQELASQIDKLADKDFRLTTKVNDGFILFRHTVYGLRWLRNNTKTFRHIKDIINQHGYPGERRIGISPMLEDSAKMTPVLMKQGLENAMDEYKVYFMLLHYYSTRRGRKIDAQLYNSMKTGDMPPYQYARINDFLAINSKGRADTTVRYYVQRDIPREPLEDVNMRRAAIGLNTYDEQVRIDEVMLERRRNGTAKSEVFLEQR